MILVIADDDEASLELFREAIERSGLDVTIYEMNNGVVLMERLHSEALALPDIIFLDLNMPLKNGIECLEEIRLDPRLKRLPVIIYSSSPNPADVDECFRKRGNLYFEKPDDFQQLQYMVGRLLTLDWSEQIAPGREGFLLKTDYFK